MNTTKKTTAFIFTIVILVIAIGIFKSSSQSSTSTSNKKDTIQVGVLLPLSTNFAWWGDAIEHSISVAQANGYTAHVQYIYEDTKCDPKDAVSATQSLKARYPDMHLFIVGCDNDLQAMFSILDKQKDMAFMVGLSSANLYESHFPVVNLAYRLETEGTLAAQFAVQKLGAKSLGIIVNNENFGNVLASSSSAYIASSGGTSTIEQLKYNDPNPETSVLKVIQSKPDAIYIQNDIPTMTAILKRLDQLGYTGKRILYYGGRDQSLIEAAGKSAEGVYVPWTISDAANPARTTFENTFKSMYNKDPFITAYFTYDGMMLLSDALAKCGNDATCIEHYIYTKDNFVGTLGKVTYKPDGEIERNFYFQQIKEGKFVEVGK